MIQGQLAIINFSHREAEEEIKEEEEEEMAEEMEMEEEMEEDMETNPTQILSWVFIIPILGVLMGRMGIRCCKFHPVQLCHLSHMFNSGIVLLYIGILPPFHFFHLFNSIPGHVTVQIQGLSMLMCCKLQGLIHVQFY